MIPLPADGVLLTDEEAAVLAVSAGAIRRYWRSNGTAVPPLVEEVLAGLGGVLNRRQARITAAAASAVGSAPLPLLLPGGSVAARSSWLTTREAAERIGISPQAVTRLCRRGTLTAEQRGGRAWFLDSGSVRRYVEMRGRRAHPERDAG